MEERDRGKRPSVWVCCEMRWREERMEGRQTDTERKMEKKRQRQKVNMAAVRA